MSISEAEELARVLYARGAGERGPKWEQLGDVTKSVWRARAAAMMAEVGDLV